MKNPREFLIDSRQIWTAQEWDLIRMKWFKLEEAIDAQLEEYYKPKITNYEVLECLVDVINQACQAKVEDDKYYLDTMALSAYEDALYLLEKMGIVKEVKGRQYLMLWEELEKYKTATPLEPIDEALEKILPKKKKCLSPNYLPPDYPGMGSEPCGECKNCLEAKTILDCKYAIISHFGVSNKLEMLDRIEGYAFSTNMVIDGEETIVFTKNLPKGDWASTTQTKISNATLILNNGSPARGNNKEE